MKTSPRPLKLVLQLVSFVGLALTIVPAVLVFLGVVSKGAYLQWMVAGMVIWFGTAVFWIKPDGLDQ
jgi:hypothetical protein